MKKTIILVLGSFLTMNAFADSFVTLEVTLKSLPVETSSEASSVSVRDYVADRLSRDTEYERTNLLKDNDLDPDEFTSLNIEPEDCRSSSRGRSRLVWICEVSIIMN